MVLLINCGPAILSSSVSVDFSIRVGSWETVDVSSDSFIHSGFFSCVVPSDHFSTKITAR